MNDWRVVSVSELQDEHVLFVEDGNHGNDRPRADEFTSTGMAFIRAADMANRRIDFLRASKINSVAEARIRKGFGRPLDVLLSHKGTVGRVAMAPADSPAFVCSPQTTYWRSLDHDAINPWFLRYFMESPDFVRQLDSRSGETDMAPYVSLTEQRRLFVTLPSIEEQRRIAGVLGALDDLIDTNRHIADDCTAAWRAIVREALADATESAPLSTLADFVNGKNFTKDASGHGRPVIRTPEVRRGPEPGTVRSDVDAADENVALEGDTLFVWSGSLTVGRWMWEEGLINQHVFKVLPKPGVPAWLVYTLIEYQMPWFLGLAADKATTMGHIKREHLDATVPLPHAGEIEQLGPIVEPLWNEALQCGVAIQEVARTRDELLPLLLSGRVRVEEAAA